jgi:hypothetical protein
MTPRRRAGWVFGLLALAAGTGCQSKTRVAGTETRKVLAIDLGRTVNSDHTIKDAAETFAPTDTIWASVQTETMGSAVIKARWTLESGELLGEATEKVPPSGITRTRFHLWKRDGLPAGKYHLEVSLDSIATGVKEFTVAPPPPPPPG